MCEKKIVERFLRMAVKTGDVDRWDYYLSQGPDLNAKDDMGETALHEAARYGEVEMCRRLIAAGAAVMAQDNAHRTPLHVAAVSSREGAADVCRLLLAAGAEVNAMNKSKETPLHHVLTHGQYECFMVLLEAGGDAYVGAPSLCSPLHGWAWANDRSVGETLSVMHRLADFGYSMSFMPDRPSKDYLTPFQLAVQMGNFAVVAAAFEVYKEDLDQVTVNGLTLLELTKRTPSKPEVARWLQAMKLERAVVSAIESEDGAPAAQELPRSPSPL